VKATKLVADPHYSSQNLRDAALKQGTMPVIPYPRNQMQGVKDILRIDGKFKSHGPQQLKRAYRKRVTVERAFSRLKNLAGLTQHNLRGLAKIAFYTFGYHFSHFFFSPITGHEAQKADNNCRSLSIFKVSLS